MGGIALAWMFGEGIVIYRWFVKNKTPAPPGALLDASILFIACAALGQYAPARTAASLFAWGIDIAVLLQVVGKEPKAATNWPPLCIPDTQILPSKSVGVACGAAQDAAASTSTGTKSKTATSAKKKGVSVAGLGQDASQGLGEVLGF